MTCTMAFFSALNSTRPPRCSRTASATSVVTVPNFGFGINPRGPKIRAISFNFDIIPGVAIALSN